VQKILRAGAFKPRTSPYAFQGMGEPGLKLMREAADKFGLFTVSEVMDPSQVEMMGHYVDIYQVGARNMQITICCARWAKCANRCCEARHVRDHGRAAA